MYLKSLVEATDEELKQASDVVEKLIGYKTPMERFWFQVWMDYHHEFMRRWKERHPRKYPGEFGKYYAGAKWGFLYY
jgi:hypothetical protein